MLSAPCAAMPTVWLWGNHSRLGLHLAVLQMLTTALSHQPNSVCNALAQGSAQRHVSEHRFAEHVTIIRPCWKAKPFGRLSGEQSQLGGCLLRKTAMPVIYLPALYSGSCLAHGGPCYKATCFRSRPLSWQKKRVNLEALGDVRAFDGRTGSCA